MTFETRRLVEFAHCDAAGMVFYPRYVEMISSVIEECFAAYVEVDFVKLHFENEIGIPTVRLDLEFRQPSRLGDRLTFRLDIIRCSTRSVEFRISCRKDDEIRFEGRQILVCTDINTGKAQAWPDTIAEKFRKGVAADA